MRELEEFEVYRNQITTYEKLLDATESNLFDLQNKLNVEKEVMMDFEKQLIDFRKQNVLEKKEPAWLVATLASRFGFSVHPSKQDVTYDKNSIDDISLKIAIQNEIIQRIKFKIEETREEALLYKKELQVRLAIMNHLPREK